MRAEPCSLPALSSIQRFLKLETAGGIVLGAAAVIALALANSPLDTFYTRLLDLPVAVEIGALAIAKPLLLWINDGLMAIFLMLVGLEVKRAAVEGELSSLPTAALPVIAALGGMPGLALVYVACNWGNAEALQGWAFPTATDIAFALGILALLGARAPPSLKIFLLALAIIDDLGAIIIIPVFYTAELSLMALILAGIGVAGLVVLNLLGVPHRATYMLVGVAIWACVLHPTLADVIVGVLMPLNAADGSSPAHDLEEAIASLSGLRRATGLRLC